MIRSELFAALEQALQGDRPVIVVLAGSNGAGKTTFYELYLESLELPFVNADRIAKTLSSNDPNPLAYQAAQLADDVRRDLVNRRLSFCMETVFSDPAGDKVQFLKSAQTGGYGILGIFIQLSDPPLSVARVAQRVRHGGHDVPDDKLHSRFERTAENIRNALQFVDLGFAIDNSSVDSPYRLIEVWANGILQPDTAPSPDDES